MKIAKIAATLLLIAIGSSTCAAIVSGQRFTDAGKAVNLQGLEWLSIDSTRGYSRADIEGGSLGYFATGWRYATRQETAGLLGSLWGGTEYGGSNSNGDGANWFFQNLGYGNLFAGTTELRSFFYGAEGECSQDTSVSCRGFYGAAYSNVGLPTTGWFYQEFGLDASYLSPGTVERTLNDDRYGSLLVRGVSNVPEPSTLLLSALGLLVALKFRRQS
jgi:PEP-CTERM motif